MKTIQISDEQYDSLMKGESITIKPPLTKWEPKGGDYLITLSGQVVEAPSDEVTKKFGVEYPTKEQAEKARNAMRKYNRLLAYVAEFDKGWTPNWFDSEQAKCEVLFNHIAGKWEHRVVWQKETVTVEMSTACAKELVCKLNSGEVEL